METTSLNFQTDVLDRSFEVAVVVDFWAEWCGPCKILGPVIEKLANEANGRWELVKVNTEKNQQLAMQYRIQSIPAVKMFHQGKVIAEFMGALPEYQILRWLEKHVPDPRLTQLEALFQQWSVSRDEAVIGQLEAFVSQNPDLQEGSLRLAGITLATDPGRAKELVAEIRQGHALYDEAEDIRAIVELVEMTIEGEEKVGESMRTAQSAWQNRQLEETLTHLIQAIIIDKSFQSELPRRAVVAIFRQLGEQHPLTKKYRPRFSMALY